MFRTGHWQLDEDVCVLRLSLAVFRANHADGKTHSALEPGNAMFVAERGGPPGYEVETTGGFTNWIKGKFKRFSERDQPK